MSVYRIHVAAASAGISTQLLRAWERRYGLLSPQRSDGGYRLYSDEDVALLRGTKLLVDEGRSISEVAKLPREQLRAAAARAAAPRPVVAATTPGALIDAAIHAIAAFDAEQLERLLLRAGGMGTLSSMETSETVLLPLLLEIGERWEKGELDVAAEHFGTAILRRHLHTMVQTEARRNVGAPAIVCASPEGELHEGGLLAFALRAAVLGWGIVYLGPHTPLREVVATADRTGAQWIALSLSIPGARAGRRALIGTLAKWRQGQPGRAVWLGGKGAVAHRQELERAGLQVLEHAGDFAQPPPSAVGGPA
jgi:DNA-binding transcriptional MerR regulator/methylmalonyl-CoA mutase cobalamin-binding subunit